MTSVVPATSQHLWATKPATFPQAMHQLMHWAELRKTDTLRIQAELVKPRKATNPIFLNNKNAAKRKVKNLQKMVDEWESPSKDWFHFKGMVQPVHELSSLQGKHTVRLKQSKNDMNYFVASDCQHKFNDLCESQALVQMMQFRVVEACTDNGYSAVHSANANAAVQPRTATRRTWLAAHAIGLV